jgi:hypothetical protein
MTNKNENKNIETYILTKRELEDMMDQDEELATMLKDAKDVYNRKIDRIKRSIIIGMGASIIAVSVLNYCSNHHKQDSTNPLYKTESVQYHKAYTTVTPDNTQ